MKRKIVSIDQEKCDGCGLCVPSCAEGAIKIVNGKAVLAADNLCDGLGACLGECPKDAITIIEREAGEFNEAAVESHLRNSGNHAEGHGHQHGHHGGCPGSRAMSFKPAPPKREEKQERGSSQSQLGQWPVQMFLVPPNATYFQDADLLITADCVPLAYADYHRDFLAGKAVVMGCPKQQDASGYVDKLTQIFRMSKIRSVTVLAMEVPCCGGLVMAAKQALAASGKDIPFEVVTIGIRGEVK
ncbi:MAG TPA: 4Fe-4S binding protein [Geobacteraceae bacterium]|nr:4Fe-4S binding protein [Geobacteraceae bacterium]